MGPTARLHTARQRPSTTHVGAQRVDEIATNGTAAGAGVPGARRTVHDLERIEVEIEAVDLTSDLREFRRRDDYEAGRDASPRFRYVSMS